MPQSTCLTRKATIKDIPLIIDNLTQAGLQDIRRSGGNPAIKILYGLEVSDTIVAFSPDNIPLCLLGVTSNGNVWLHMTNEVYKYPRFFMKEAKAWLAKQQHQLLFNYIDIQNTALLKMVKKLGFKFLRVVPMTSNNIYYVEFVRLWQQTG